MDKLTPKGIIFEAVRKKLEGTSITKIVLVFNVVNDRYSVMFSQDDNKSIKVDIDKDEINMLKKVLISKIKRKIDQDYKYDYETIILQICLKAEEFNVFVQNIHKDVHKIEF